MTSTGIEYVDRVWPVVRGCSGKVSTGCKECWAERFARREGRDFRRVELCDHKVLWAPERWRSAGTVFVAPGGDLFDPAVPDEHIRAVFLAIANAPRQRFLVLTKRSERMRDLINSWESIRATAGLNVALGVSVENQETAHERLADLLATRCKVRWVSYEPALEPVDFRNYFQRPMHPVGPAPEIRGLQLGIVEPSIDWVVIGGESARPLSRARPVNIAWFYETVGACGLAGVPIFVKQMGSAYALSQGWRDPRGADPAQWAPALRVREALRWPVAEDGLT